VFAALQNRRTRWLIALAVWPVLALAVATQTYVYRAGFRYPIGWLDALRYPAVEYLFWAVAAPIVYSLALRFRLARKGWTRNAAILLGWGVVVDIAHALYRAPLHGLVYPRFMVPEMPVVPVAQLAEFYAIGNVIGDLWVFATIVAIAHLAHYYTRYEDREREWAVARLQVLEARLQPHFLFNTLNSIATLMHEDVDAADEMMTNLATLLRRTLNQSNAYEIPLRDEIELLNIYLEIERTRFQDRLTTLVDAPETVLDALVPRLILQPLVENAVRHGISRRPGAGCIEVRAWREGDQLNLTVRNDGPEPEASSGSGFGLANTRARLAQHYENRCHFALRPAATGGAIAEIAIPYLPAGAAAAVEER